MLPSRLLARLRRPTPGRVLDATRILGTGVVATIGQLVVDMPTGYFGGVDHVTVLGIAYAAAMLAVMAACAFGSLVGWRPVRWVFPPLLLIGTAFFLPAMAQDMAVGGSIIAWQLASLARVVFADAPVAGRRSRWLEATPLRPAVIHGLTLSIFCTVLVAGFELTEMLIGQVLCGVVDVIAIAAAMIVLGPRSLVRWAVASALVMLLVASLGQTLMAVLVGLGVAQLGLLAIAVFRGPVATELVRQFVERPALLVVSTFGAVALLGAVALTFPLAAEHERIGPLDALFTAVSATCVTGLAVVDTPTAFSPFGELVILLLFQIGGLGIMVLSTFGTIILGGRLTLRGQRALEHVLDIASPAHAYRLVRFIVLATVGLEAAGAALLAWRYLVHGTTLGDALWRGIFQSISAFCNAGFSLQTDSVVIFQRDPIALGVHAVLIILGGLGFVVLAWTWSRVMRHDRTRAPVQVRVVLGMSAALVVVGCAIYASLEWDRSLAGLSTADKLSNALFQSVTTRTAGFNSVDLTQMRPATTLFVIVFMFIGAAPGGTGGGIKITTLAVLAAAVPDIVGARRGVLLFGRVIPHDTLQRAATIAVVAATATVTALFLLLLTEDAPFMVLAFETVSALGTVGLSLGVTASLTATSKWVLIVTMFIGRVGPLTMALALGQRDRKHVQYPETRIMVG